MQFLFDAVELRFSVFDQFQANRINGISSDKFK